MSHVTHVDKLCYTCFQANYCVYRVLEEAAGHPNESCHIYGWVTRMSHVTYMDESNESCHIYGWVMSHIWMSHVTRIPSTWRGCGTPKLWRACKWVMSHIWMSHVTYMDELFNTYFEAKHHIYRVIGESKVHSNRHAHVVESCHMCGWVTSHMWTLCTWDMSHM